MSIKLVATDIDGTILKHGENFTPEVKDCIKTLVEKGVKVVLVTGRMHKSAVQIFEKLGLKTPLASYQGGLIKDGSDTLYERFLPQDCLEAIVRWARENDIHINFYVNDELFVEQDHREITTYSQQQNIEYKKVDNVLDLDLTKVNKILVLDSDSAERVSGYADYLETTFPQVNIVKSSPYFCEISHPEAQKSHAVEFLQNHYGLEKHEVLTIGDQNNDIALLKAGGIKVAMGNATDTLKSMADFVTDTVDNNGFVKAMEKFVEAYDV